MRYLIFLFLIVVSCSKEPLKIGPDCTPDGIGTFDIYNGFHIPLDVYLVSGDISGGGELDSTEIAYRLLKVGETWEKEIPVGKWYVKAIGEEPGPYAHDTYEFESSGDLDDCEVWKIQY